MQKRDVSSYSTICFIFLIFLGFAITSSQAQSRLPYDDPRYQEYLSIRDAYEVKYEAWMNTVDPAIKAPIERDIIELNKEINKLREADQVSNPNRSQTSEELGERLGRLYVETDWSSMYNPRTDRERKHRLSEGGAVYRPWKKYLEAQKRLDELSAQLERELNAADKKSAIDRLKVDVIDYLSAAILQLKAGRTQVPELNRRFELLQREARDLLKRKDPPTNKLDRQAFIRQLEAQKKGIETAFATFNRRFGTDNINATYVAEFQKAGGSDWNGNAAAWGPSFWLSYVHHSQVGGTYYDRPLARLSESIANLKRGRPFTQDDVNYYRERSAYWRVNAPRLTLLLNQKIQLSVEFNTDQIAHYKRKTMKEAEFNQRNAARQPRHRQIDSELNELGKAAVFDRTVGG